MPTYHVVHTSSRGGETVHWAVYPDDASAIRSGRLALSSRLPTAMVGRKTPGAPEVVWLGRWQWKDGGPEWHGHAGTVTAR